MDLSRNIPFEIPHRQRTCVPDTGVPTGGMGGGGGDGAGGGGGGGRGGSAPFSGTGPVARGGGGGGGGEGASSSAPSSSPNTGPVNRGSSLNESARLSVSYLSSPGAVQCWKGQATRQRGQVVISAIIVPEHGPCAHQEAPSVSAVFLKHLIDEMESDSHIASR